MKRCSQILAAAALTVSLLLTACAQSGPAAPTSTAPSATTTAPASPPPLRPVTPTPTATTAAVQRGGTFRWIETSGPGTPIGAEWDGYNYNAGEWAMDVLIKSFPDGSMTGNSALAHDFKIDATANPPTMTFFLRKGIKFIDGTDLNAQAVKWNMEMITKGGLYKSTTDYWKAFDVVDDHTLRVTFPMWRNTMLRAWENYYVVSPTAYDRNGNDWMRLNIVGTGPFKQTDFQRDVATKYTKNDSYWQKGKPYLDGVQMLYVADQLTQEAIMRSGGAEALTTNPKVGSRFLNDPAFNVVTKAAGQISMVPDSLNTDSPFAKLQVRQALQYAVDREGLAKAFGFGFAKPAYQMGSPSSMAYVPTLAAYKQEIAKAKQLLADAGYPNGFKTTMYVNPQLDKDPATAVQAQLAAVGITATMEFPLPAKWTTLTINPVTPSSALFFTRIDEMANYNTYMNVYWADPGTFTFLSTKKPDGWKDLFAKSLTSPSPDKAILQQVGSAFYNDSTITPLYYNSIVYVLSPKVKDHGLFTWGWDALWSREDMWLSK